MRKITIGEAYPDIADQLVDQSLRDKLSSCANEKVDWVCAKGHIWNALVVNRTKKGYGCPYCAGRLPIVGINDLATKHPDLATQLVDPSLAQTLLENSHTKVKWKCKHGHIWTAPVSARTTKKSGCPYCSGRLPIPGETDLATTHPELAAQLVNQELATKLKAGTNKKVKWRCNNGHVWEASPNTRTHVGSGCPYCSGRDAITDENDLATTHPELTKQLVDKKLAHRLKANSNKKVAWHCEHEHVWNASVANRCAHHQGCPYCAGQRVMVGFNDLKTVRPDLAKQLVDPAEATKVTVASHKVLTWKCAYGHTWDAIVSNRTTQNQGCPYCSGHRIIVGKTDLATTHPEIAKLLADETQATRVSYGSNAKLKWNGDCGHTWTAKVNTMVARGGHCPECWKTGISIAEKTLAEIVRTLVAPLEVIENDRTILPNNKELDIVIPDKHMAIEFNGLYWHSDAVRDDARTLHQEKTVLAKNANYQLIHVWEDDWKNKQEIVIRAIAAKLGVTNNLDRLNMPQETYKKLGARQLAIVEPSHREAKAFLDNNHMQGTTMFTRAFALENNGRICALMAIRSAKANSRSRRSEGTWEIVRYATEGTIPGGFGRLLKAAHRTLENEGIALHQWITFADETVSNGHLYETLGFVCDRQLPPDYRYVGAYTKWNRMPKEKFQKKRFLNDPSLTFDPTMTERELAKKNGLYRVYDAGKRRYVLSIT